MAGSSQKGVCLSGTELKLDSDLKGALGVTKVAKVSPLDFGKIKQISAGFWFPLDSMRFGTGVPKEVGQPSRNLLFYGPTSVDGSHPLTPPSPPRQLVLQSPEHHELKEGQSSSSCLPAAAPPPPKEHQDDQSSFCKKMFSCLCDGC